MAEYYDEHSPLLQPSKPERGLKRSSSGSQLSANNSGQYERKRCHTISTGRRTRLSSNMRTQLDVKDGEFFSAKLLKSMQEMEKIIDHKAIFISVFGQHNCGKSSFLNALMGETYLATSPMNETSMRVTIHHDSQVHPGFCCEDKCARKEYQTCPKLTKITMNSDTKVVIGPKNVQHELKHINEQVRQANATPLVTSLTLTVSLPLLTYNVPPGWTVSLVDTPGFGEANEYIQQLAEESVEVSAAYIYLLQTESIGGIEAKEMFASIAKKDPGAFADGRLIVAITKFDTNYQQSDDSDDEYNNTSHCAHVKIEEKIKKKLYNHIEDATQLNLSPDFILPVCGQWALCGSKLDSYLSCNQCDTHYEKRLKAATDALSKHPKLSTLSIPGAQGQAELETIKQLHPYTVVQHLDRITGFECLKTKIQCMVGKCIKLWSKKVNREYTNYISEAKKKIDEKIVELEKNAKEIQTEQKLSESKNRDIMSLYSEVHEYVTIKENSELWTKIAENYDEDVQESRMIQEGKKLVSSMVERFKDYCIQRFQQRSSECFGEAQFNEGISDLLSGTAEELTTKFGTCHFKRITDTRMEDVHDFAGKCEKLNERARQLCSHLHIDMDKLNIPLRPRNETSSLSKILMLSDIKAKTAIPSLLRIEKNDGCYSYREWNDELENVLRETEDLMKQKCESYFDEIKHETVEHFCKITTQKVKVDLIPYEQIYRSHIEQGIKQLKQNLKELHDKQKDLKCKITHLNNLQYQLEESFDKEFRLYI